jgi:hypothetical protein
MRLITDADPLSAPINDVILRINKNYGSIVLLVYIGITDTIWLYH